MQALASADGTAASRNKIGSTIFPLVRQPSNSNRGVKGHVHCYKAGGHVPHESDIERKFYQLMEWDYTVDTFAIDLCSHVQQRHVSQRNQSALNASFFFGNARQHKKGVDAQSTGGLRELSKVAEPYDSPATRRKGKWKSVLFSQSIYALLRADTVSALEAHQILPHPILAINFVNSH